MKKKNGNAFTERHPWGDSLRHIQISLLRIPHWFEHTRPIAFSSAAKEAKGSANKAQVIAEWYEARTGHKAHRFSVNNARSYTGTSWFVPEIEQTIGQENWLFISNFPILRVKALQRERSEVGQHRPDSRLDSRFINCLEFWCSQPPDLFAEDGDTD